MGVVDLTARRDQLRGQEPGRCACGCEWFTLHGRPNDPPIAEHGAITVSGQGEVTGYCGYLRCSECGEPWSPPGELLGF